MKTERGRMTAWIGFLTFVALAVAPRANAVPLPLNGSWTVLIQDMKPGDFFTGDFDFTSSLPVLFKITDLYVVSDQFELYDDGALVLTTPSKPDWPALGFSGAFQAPPWTDDPDVALASGFFSNSTFLFAPGNHSLTIRDIHIPPGCIEGTDVTCRDGTVAFSAITESGGGQAVPEPTTLGLLGAGFLLISVPWRRLRRSPAYRPTAPA